MMGKLVAVDENGAGYRTRQAEQRAHQRRLAGAVVADDAEHLAGAHLDRHIAQHGLAAVADDERFRAENRTGRHGARSPK